MTSDTDLFARLGGTRAVADMIGEPPSTVQSWKTARRIPSTKQPMVIEKVRKAGHIITAHDVVFPFGAPTTPIEQKEAA